MDGAPWEELTPRQRDALVGQYLFGQAITWDGDTPIVTGAGESQPLGVAVLTNPMTAPIPGGYRVSGGHWEPARFTTDANATHLVEAELARREIQLFYINRLRALAPDLRDEWWLATAPPDVRCRAALRACGVEL